MKKVPRKPPEIDLSEAIDPDEVTATVQDGTFEIQMKKADPCKNTAATVEAVKATARAPASRATPWKGSGPNHEIAD